MKPSSKKNMTACRISPARIKAFKKLAQRIDTQEQEQIKAMGRYLFERHDVARTLVRQLKVKRMENGMSLTELANRTGIAKSNLSRLENNKRVSPTLVTLQRYAQALGMQVRVELN